MNKTFMDVFTMLSFAGIDAVRVETRNGDEIGMFFSIETPINYFGKREVHRIGFEHDILDEINILCVVLADNWKRAGSPEECELMEKSEEMTDGAYMVRCYDRQGNLMVTRYADTEADAAKIRILHAASIGVYEWMRGKWSLFPTIWEKDDGGEFHRVTKYA